MPPRDDGPTRAEQRDRRVIRAALVVTQTHRARPTLAAIGTVTDEDRRLIRAWVVAFVLPHNPYIAAGRSDAREASRAGTGCQIEGALLINPTVKNKISSLFL